MKNFFLIFVIFFLTSATFFAQDLPNGFRNIKLGMGIDEVKAALKKDASFGYRGERDVSLLPGENRAIIETDTSRTAPFSFLSKCYFQFYEEKLYIITINLRQKKVDHYSVYSSLTKKYGNPIFISPDKSEWKNDNVIMTLERPLALKYTDNTVFEKILSESMVNKSAEEEARDKFLDSL